MKPYRNLSGDSGVTHYEIGSDFIAVRFRKGDKYLYNYRRPGRYEVEEMKRLAVAGQGLSTFISQQVRERYVEKLD
ncbi:MAG TPA: hypothetical protein VGM59_04520 [Dongiaceae bacterium]